MMPLEDFGVGQFRPILQYHTPLLNVYIIYAEQLSLYHNVEQLSLDSI